MSKIIISDASCLIALDRINRLTLLQKLFSSVSTTSEVQTEYGNVLPTWIEIREVKNLVRQRELEVILDKGEASAVALALELPDAVLIINEKRGRRIARELNLEILGTLKILVLAKQRGIISNVSEVMDELDRKNFRFNKKVRETILKEAGEL